MIDPSSAPATYLHLGITETTTRSLGQWALAADSAAEPTSRPSFEAMFPLDRWDPDFEEPGTLWLTHWALASRPRQTCWYWLFNHLPTPEFTVDSATEWLVQLAREHGWRKAAPDSLRREVEVWLRCYLAERSGRTVEDAHERPLAGLELIRVGSRGASEVGSRGASEVAYVLGRELRASLPPEVFGIAAHEFMQERGVASVTAGELLFAPGSPGRVFGLDEEGLACQLVALGAELHRYYEIETGADGLRLRLTTDFFPLDLIDCMYAARGRRGGRN